MSVAIFGCGLSQGKFSIALSSSGRLSLRPLCGKFFVGCAGRPVREESVFRVLVSETVFVCITIFGGLGHVGLCHAGLVM